MLAVICDVWVVWGICARTLSLMSLNSAIVWCLHFHTTPTEIPLLIHFFYQMQSVLSSVALGGNRSKGTKTLNSIPWRRQQRSIPLSFPRILGNSACSLLILATLLMHYRYLREFFSELRTKFFDPKMNDGSVMIVYFLKSDKIFFYLSFRAVLSCWNKYYGRQRRKKMLPAKYVAGNSRRNSTQLKMVNRKIQSKNN